MRNRRLEGGNLLGGNILSGNAPKVVNTGSCWGTREAGGSAGHRKRFLSDLEVKIVCHCIEIRIVRIPGIEQEALPVIVALHRKKFSFSGNAETLFSVLIMSAISSFCNLRAGGNFY